MSGRKSMTVGMVWVALTWGLGLGSARAQPAAAPSAAQALTSYMGPVYRDSSYGFEIRPFSSLSPAQHAGGADQDQVMTERTKETNVISDSTTLVRFSWPERGWLLRVEEHQAKPEMTAKDLLVDLVSLSADDKGSVRFFERDLAGRKASGAVYIGSETERRAIRQTMVVRVRPGQFFVLLFESPNDLRAQAEKDFGTVLDSFKIFDSDVTRDMLASAAERGAAVVTKARNSRLEHMLFPETWYAIQMPVPSQRDPKLAPLQTVGFLRVVERKGDYVVTRKTKEGRGETIPGLLIEERGRIYQPDGAVVTIWKDFFIAATGDLATSTILGGFTKPITNDDGTPRVGPDGKPLLNRQFTTCKTLRQDNTLLVEFSEELSDLAKKSLAFAVGENFLDPIMDRLLSRLIDLKVKQLLAFKVFNQDREGLGSNTVQVVGPQAIEIDGRLEPTVLLESREGLDSPPSRMWMDAKGQMVKTQNGDMVLVRTPKAVLQAKYDEARAADTPGGPFPTPTPKATPKGKR